MQIDPDQERASSRALWRGIRNAALIAIPTWLLFYWLLAR